MQPVTTEIVEITIDGEVYEVGDEFNIDEDGEDSWLAATPGVVEWRASVDSWRITHVKYATPYANTAHRIPVAAR